MLRRRAQGFLAASGVLLTLFPAAAAAQVRPVINVSSPTAAPGTTVVVNGSNWPVGGLVRLQICGNAAARGSMDCAQEASSILPPTPEGTFLVRIPVVVPPMPCPCVIEASIASQRDKITVPITIIGVPVAPIQQAVVPAPSLAVVDADLDGWGPITAWFGGAPERTLTLRLRNTGSEPIDVPPFTLMRGRAARVDTVVRQIDLGVVPAGRTRTFLIPVAFEPVSIGKYAVRGTINEGRAVPFRAETRSYPWGLLGLALIGLQVVLIRLRNRARQRLTRDDPLPPVPGLEPLLGDVDPLDYWGWWVDPVPRAIAAAPVHPWSVDSHGSVWRPAERVIAPADAPIDVRADERAPDDVLEHVTVPELPPDFRRGAERHRRRSPRSARPGRRNSTR